MCEFVSFKVAQNPLRVLCAPSLDNHSDIEADGFECEWVQYDHKDFIEVRTPTCVSIWVEKHIRNWLLATYHNRDNFILALAREICKQGNIPNIWRWLDDRRKRLFACDIAEYALPAIKKAYPRRTIPKKSILTARKYAEGKCSLEELQEVHRAAYDFYWSAKSLGVDHLLWIVENITSDTDLRVGSILNLAEGRVCDKKQMAERLLYYLNGEKEVDENTE